MSNFQDWLHDFSIASNLAVFDGIVPVKGYNTVGRPVEEVEIMEKAAHYRADAVFFEASFGGKAAVPQAFLYRTEGPSIDSEFAELHKRLWSWGGVPLVYRVTNGLVELFRCAHRPDFEKNGELILKPFRVLNLAEKIANDPWWNAERLRSGTLWDDPDVCKQLLSSQQSAHKTLIQAVKELHHDLNASGFLPKPLRRRLLILSILIAYLEKRGVFEAAFFEQFLTGATAFFEVLADGPALVSLLKHLERRFNGHVFTISAQDQEILKSSSDLLHYAHMVEGRQEPGGQRTLWQRYSFADLPVELLSHIYQLFVKDSDVAVYTPHFVVRLMLGEVLSWERLDSLVAHDEVILDPACGSGIFLVEAFKRLVLHWRYRHSWQRPDSETLQTLLTTRIRGVDLEEGAVELAAFSLCLALCDALEPVEIRASVNLFPALKEHTIHTSCFFEACESRKISEKVGVIVGNPPFGASLDTDGAQRAYDGYINKYGMLPDKQIAYLFLHQSMTLLSPGGILTMLQQYNLLYNQQSSDFRRNFFQQWDVREVLDFVSIRGIFSKGSADTKVVVVVAEAQQPPHDRAVLHVTFRRTGRVDAEQGFDVDYYDMHWLSRHLILANDNVWRCNLVGGGRVLSFVNRLQQMRTLGQYATSQQWDHGEGFIVGKSGRRLPAPHLTGQPLVPSEAITADGIAEDEITTVADKLFKTPYSHKRFSPPLLLIREHMNLDYALWVSSYLTYKNKVVGISGNDASDEQLLAEICAWLESEKIALQAYVAATSIRLFTQKATTLSEVDVLSLPYPDSKSLALTVHEQIVVSDVVEYYRDLVRIGEKSEAMTKSGGRALSAFNSVFTSQVNGVYSHNKLQALQSFTWPGVVCQPYSFGKARVEWDGADELKDRLDALLKEQRGGGINVNRIARIYDEAYIYLIKPNRLRYWLRSIALRDADETLADLAEQGF